jgi:hypothetical protein
MAARDRVGARSLVTGVLSWSYGVALNTTTELKNDVWVAACALSEKSARFEKIKKAPGKIFPSMASLH